MRGGRRRAPVAWAAAVAAAAGVALLAPGGLLTGTPARATAPPAEHAFSFAVVGHLRGEPDGTPFFLMDELLADLARLHPDLVFLTGDLIYGDWDKPHPDAAHVTADWDALDARLASLGIPVYRVPGNHDINDPVTRDIWFARYGRPPQALSYGGSRFLLLASPYIPEGDQPPALPRPYPRGRDLDAAQRDFLRGELAHADRFDHVFVFLHHVLWWEPDAAWWREVHPLLVGHRVSAVFAGDYGPLKYSHEARDGIDYFQSALEWKIPVPILRSLEDARIMNFQFDNFLLVSVRGPEVDVRVQVLGAHTSGKYTPELWHQVFAAPAKAGRPHRKGPRRDRLRRAAVAALALGAAFAAGAGVACWLARRRRAA